MSSGVQYTRERLAEAAAQCSDFDEVIAFFGTRPYAQLRRHIFRRFDHFGIDVSHMPRQRRAREVSTRPTADELHGAVEGATSVADTLRALGMEPYNSRLRAQLRCWVTEDGLDTSHFLGQAHQRGGPGTTPLRRAEDILSSMTASVGPERAYSAGRSWKWAHPRSAPSAEQVPSGSGNP